MKIIIIQQGILRDLEPSLDLYNEDNRPRLKMDVAVFFIGLINELNSHYRDDEMGKSNHFTPLYSVILKSYHSSYKKYFDFLVKSDFLDKDNFGADIGKSASYKIKDKYIKDGVMLYRID